MKAVLPYVLFVPHSLQFFIFLKTRNSDTLQHFNVMYQLCKTCVTVECEMRLAKGLMSTSMRCQLTVMLLTRCCCCWSESAGVKGPCQFSGRKIVAWSALVKWRMCQLYLWLKKLDFYFFIFPLCLFIFCFYELEFLDMASRAGIAHTIPLAPKRSQIWTISQIIHLPLQLAFQSIWPWQRGQMRNCLSSAFKEEERGSFLVVT